MDKIIIVDHLSLSDKLKDISFTIQKGEFVGIVGATGSGKTSILETISGLIKPTSGFVSVLGHDPYLRSHDFLKQISFMSNQRNQLLKNSPAIDLLETTKNIYGVSDRDFNKNLNELTQFTTDPNLLDALIYKPKVLILDESDVDLDSVYKYNIKVESTVLLTTNRIDNLINLVRRIIFIDKGQILFDGAIDEIITKFGTEKIIKAKLSSTIDERLVSEIGTVRKYVYPYLYVSAPRSVISFAAAELIQNFPVIKLDIEELSVEEIIENMNHGI